MLNQIHQRQCGNCQSTTFFTPVRVGNVAGLKCLNCGKRWVIHLCSHGSASLETELLPLLVDFGVKAAYDAFCPGCRRGISILTGAATAVEPFNPQLAKALNDAAQVLAVVATIVTAVGAAKWLARQIR